MRPDMTPLVRQARWPEGPSRRFGIDAHRARALSQTDKSRLSGGAARSQIVCDKPFVFLPF